MMWNKFKSISLAGHIALCVVLTSAATTALSNTQPDPYAAYEKDLDTTIRQACFGFLKGDLPDFLEDFLDKNTSHCDAIRKQPNAYAYVQQHHPQKMALIKQWKPFDLNDKNIDIGIQCDQDAMCLQIRKQYERSANPVSQDAYDKVAQHCENEPTAYGCIEDWFRQWPRPLPGNPQTVQLSLDTLLQKQQASADSSSAAATGSAQQQTAQSELAAEIAAIQSAHTAKATLGDVLKDRHTTRLSNARADMYKLEDKLGKKCQCSISASKQCYHPPSLEFANIRSSLETNLKQVSTQRQETCSQWQTLAANQTVTGEKLQWTQKRATDLAQLLSNIENNDKSAKAQMDAALKMEEDQRWAMQEAERKSGDKAFLTALAVGVGGAVAMESAGINYDASAWGRQAADIGNKVGRGGSVSDALMEAGQAAVGNAQSTTQTMQQELDSLAAQTQVDTSIYGLDGRVGPSASVFKPNNTASEQASSQQGQQQEEQQQQAQQQNALESKILGSWYDSGAWDTCFVLMAGGQLRWNQQTQVDVRQSGNDVAWNQTALNGTWQLNGNSLSISASGTWVKHGLGETFPKSINRSYSVTEDGQVSHFSRQGCP